jgi:hypothetical protein
MITSAERRFPVRIRIGVSPRSQPAHTQITAWLDENRSADGWARTPSGTRGVLNDALSIFFAEATLAHAFVARWRIGAKVEMAGGSSGSAAVMRGHGSAQGRIKHLEGVEIMPASGTRDYPRTVMGSARKALQENLMRVLGWYCRGCLL